MTLLMVFLKNALMCIWKVSLYNHDYLPILALLYIMLAYLMSFTALSNAVACKMLFFAIDFCKCFLFHALPWFTDT